jgi:predicted ATPase
MVNIVVLTGGPGAGKTTVLEQLRKKGYSCSNEVGREVIQQQLKQKGTALPWRDKTAFRDAMLKQELSRYREYNHQQGSVFFDRGILDSLAYSRLEGLELDEKWCYLFDELTVHKTVFLFPPWQEIFTNDAERKQDFKEAILTYEHMVSVYSEYGYTLMNVPCVSVDERTHFILNTLAE